MWHASLSLLLATLPTALPTAPEVRALDPNIFALIVGANASSDPELRDLRYADDDAIQNARLFSQVGARVVLLTSLDRESANMYPHLKATPPTRRAVDAAMRTLNALMQASRDRGGHPVFYFVYSGHGDVENNEGYVTLQDSKFRRSDLLALLRTSSATTQHVIVDACSSYFLAFPRGRSGDRAPASGHFVLADESLPANTGVLLSTSSAIDSHEWEAFQGGIFSHEVRSALRGGADLDLDRVVTYEEAEAFIWAANADVPNPRFRPHVFARPPRGMTPDRAPMLTIGGFEEAEAPTMNLLMVGPGIENHLYVEDERGTRFLDLRPAFTQRLELFLPQDRPLFVRYVNSDNEVTLPEGQRLDLAMLPVTQSKSARRGAEHAAFRRLFQRPFSFEVVKRFRERPTESFESDIRTEDSSSFLRNTLGITGLGAGVAGGYSVPVQQVDSVRGRNPWT